MHTWNDGLDDDEGEPKLGRRVNAHLQHDERLYRSAPTGNRGYWYDDE